MMDLPQFKINSSSIVTVTAASLVMAVMAGCRTAEERPLLDSRGTLPAPYTDTEAEREEAPSEIPEMDAFEDDRPAAPEDEEMETADLPEDSSPGEQPDLPEVETDEEEVSYTVKKGDTLWGIAQSYDIRHQELAEFNDLDPDDTLRTGMELQIPPGGRTEPKEDSSRDSGQADTPDVEVSDEAYTVKKGDNLWGIAQRHGIKVKDLKAANNLSGDTIRAGQELQLPDGADTAEQDEEDREEEAIVPSSPRSSDDEEDGDDEEEEREADDETEDDREATEEDDEEEEGDFPNELTHRVGEGETLNSIAEMYRTTEKAIIQANSGIDDDDDLSPGEEIVVPFD